MIEQQAGMFVVNPHLANDLKYGDDYARQLAGAPRPSGVIEPTIRCS